MKNAILFACLLFINTSFAQLNKTYFIERTATRSIELSDPLNHWLQEINASDDSCQTFIAMLQHALTKGALRAYHDINDTIAMDQLSKATAISTTCDRYIFLEKWRFVPEIRKMVIIVAGIAPAYCEANDTVYKPLFWINYDSLRAISAHYYVAGTKMSVDDYFESRNFKSRIINVVVTDTIYYLQKAGN